MTVYRLSPIWGQTWVGVGESYITPDVSSSAVTDLFEDFMALRMGLLPTTAYVFAWRWGVYGGGNKSVLLRAPFARFPPTGASIGVQANGQLNPTKANGWPPLMGVSLQLNAQFGATDPRSSRKFLCGLPSNVIQGQPATFNSGGNTAWTKTLGNFTAFLISKGFQIAAQDQEAASPIQIRGVTVQSAAPSLVGVIISTSTPIAIAAGDTVYTQRFLPAKGTRSATMNGHWTVDSTTFNSVTQQFIVYLRGSAGIDPTQQRITQKTRIQKKLSKLYPIQQLDGVQVITHKRGKVGGAPRGRRLIRPSLDP